VRSLAILLFFFLTSAASAAPGERYHVEIKGVDAVPNAPANISVKAKQLLADLLKSRPEFVPELEGAPDPAADPVAYRAWLTKNKMRSLSVTINVSTFERTLEPNTKKGKTGQILSYHIEVSLVGTQIPDDLLAVGGSGGSTVMAEIGKTIRPKDEEYTSDQALTEALTHAVDEAVTKLRANKPTTVKKH
jgi:hypothetical protein